MRSINADALEPAVEPCRTTLVGGHTWSTACDTRHGDHPAACYSGPVAVARAITLLDRALVVMRRSIAALGLAIGVSVLATAAAAAPLGLPGPEVALVPFALLAPMPIVGLVLAYSRKRRGKGRGLLAIAGLAVAMLYALLLAPIYLVGIFGDTPFDPVVAFTTSIILAALVALLWSYFCNSARQRRTAVVTSILGLLVASTLTPGIVSLHYYSFVENDPLDGPGESARFFANRYVERADGTVLTYEGRLGDGIRKARFTAAGAGTFRVTYAARNRFPRGRDVPRYRSRQSAWLKVALFEVEVDRYRRAELGTAQVLPVRAGNDLKLYWHTADASCRDDEVGTLLAAGADPNFRGAELHASPIYWAIVRRCAGVVERLIRAGASLSVRNENLDTPLHWAVKVWPGGSTELTRRLIEAGADVSARNRDGNTPLHLAAKERVATTRLLIAAGADLSALNDAGETPLAHVENDGRRVQDARGVSTLDLLREAMSE